MERTCLIMDLQKMANVIDGRIVANGIMSRTGYNTAFASDLMSDVLTLEQDNVVLITGLATLQTIRTAEMADINCIIFVRNKKVSPEMIRLANEAGINLIECRYSMFRASGLLYQAGLNPVY